MSRSGAHTSLDSPVDPTFATTHWSVVLAAGDAEIPDCDTALAELCQEYWYPLYAFVRRKGYNPEDAQDLTQEFFARMIEKRFLSIADPRKGRFRTFLLTALDRFLIKEWIKTHRQKRGGFRQFISLDDREAEQRYQLEPTADWSAERIFDRRWVLTLLARTLEHLRSECEASGKEELFTEVQTMLAGETLDSSYAEIAPRLHLSEGALKVAIHRLRQRYGELLREEVAKTVATAEEVDDEIRYLLGVL